jgi:hypothetical protein
LLLAALAAMPSLAPAQTPPVIETLSASATTAYTWRDGDTSVMHLEGPAVLQLDDVTMSADAVVVWVKSVPGEVFERRQLEVALLGHAQLRQGEVTRSGDRLFVTAVVRGPVRLSAQQRLNRPRIDSPDFQLATAMRAESGLTVAPQTDHWRLPTPTPALDISPTTRPVSEPVPQSVQLRFRNLETYQLEDGNIAAAIAGGIEAIVRQPGEQTVQMSAERAVVLTRLKKFTDLESGGGSLQLEQAVEGIYLEGDVRIEAVGKNPSAPTNRLRAARAYYEVTTNRAVLTDAVLHTADPNRNIPIVVRAARLKQLSQEEGRAEYKAEQLRLTTSSFATPTFAIAASKAYIRQVDPGDDFGTRTTFVAKNTTARAWGVPVFWTPYAGGYVTENGFPLRNVSVGSSNRLGTFVQTEWGLFESIGRMPPKDLDVSYRADYLSERGPAGGLDAQYKGGFITPDTRQPWHFSGDFTSYLLSDSGEDDFGGRRRDVEPDDSFRGRAAWQHQHFLPDDWQVQIRTAWVSDPTFLEQFFPSVYRSDQPQDVSLYLKHQRDTEAFTFLAQLQPNDMVTTSEFAQEQLEVERLPEIGYHRIGDSFGGDAFTYFGDTTAARLSYQRSDYTLAEQGYPRRLSPGIAVEGRYGITSDDVDRVDTRHEIAHPVSVGRFRVVPYVVGRGTYYSETLDGGSESRILGGAGLRATTAFWKVDDSAVSELFDIHRIRHVMEPELNLFASGQTVDQQELYIFDETVDRVNDVQAVQLALHNRWQTKRGGPGNWQSVDFLTWNIEANFFANTPRREALDPQTFRGLYFTSLPEASMPRDSVNTDVSWRITDSTAVISDAQYNLDEAELATTAMGVIVRRGDRMDWYLGNRYINELDSSILSFLMNYQVSTRYSLSLGQSYDFGGDHDTTSTVSFTRRFDMFYLTAGVRRNETDGDHGFILNIRPAHLGRPLRALQ